MAEVTPVQDEAQPAGFVDWHTHVWRPEHLGDEWGPGLDTHYAHVPSQAGTVEQHREMMDRGGPRQAVVIALHSLHFELDVPNEYVADYVRSDPARLVGVGSADPNDPDAVARAEYALGDLGLRGLKLAPPYQDFHPHEPKAYELYELVQDHGGFVIFHQGAVSLRRGVLDHANPILLDRVARDFPELPIVIAHMGQPWFAETVALLRKHPNVFGDVSARCQRPAQLAGILRSVLDYGAQGKLLFGSDFPVFDPVDHARSLRSVASTPGLDIDSAVVDALLYDRPLSLLGITD